MNSPCTGYYSVIQYCPDHSRAEAANVGVLLFCPSRNFLKARTAQGNDRVRRFFQDEVGDLDQLNLMKRLLEDRVSAEAANIRDGAALQKFVRLLANELIMTDPRPVRVEDPEVELSQLFEELVGGRARRDPSPIAQITETLRAKLEQPDLLSRIKRHVKVAVPVIGEILEADYAFQNGRLNLIQAKEFAQNRAADVLREAYKTAVEGHLLFKHPEAASGGGGFQLVVVAEFAGNAVEQQERVRTVLHEHDVSFYTSDGIDQLAEKIRATAH